MKRAKLDENAVRCAICGRACRWRVIGWWCDKCQAHTSVGIEAAEEE